MLKVVGVNQANLTGVIANGTTYDVEWKEIGTPDNPAATGRREQLRLGAGTRAGRGHVRAPRRRVVRQRREDLHRLDQRRRQRAADRCGSTRRPTRQLRMLFQSPGPEVLNAPDNICVSPRGGLVLCEDGSGDEFLHGLTVDGEIFPFAKNNAVLNGERNGIVGDFSGSEWAGRLLQPGRQVALCQPPEPRDHVRHHRSLEVGRAVRTETGGGDSWGAVAAGASLQP